MAINGVLASQAIHQAIMQVNLVKLVPVAQRTTGYVNGLPRVLVVDREYDAVARVGQGAADLVLVQV